MAFIDTSVRHRSQAAKASRRLRGMALMDILHSPDKYEILDVPNDARVFSSALHDFGQVFDNSRLESNTSWAPGPKFQQHGLNEYIVLDAGAPRLIGGVVISGCGCCSAHASQVRLSVSLHGGPDEAGAWIECGDHDCCKNYPNPGGYDVLEIEPTLAQFVKINPREWREGENHAALRCALLIVQETLVVTLAFTEHGVVATNLAGEIILEMAFSDDTNLAAISSSVKDITKHDGPVKLISADGTLLNENLDILPASEVCVGSSPGSDARVKEDTVFFDIGDRDDDDVDALLEEELCQFIASANKKEVSKM